MNDKCRPILNNAQLQKLAKTRHLSLFLDYDGTLAPIAKTPAQAALPKTVRCLIEKLKHLKQVQIIIISGRSLKDLVKMVGIKKEIIYSGNHGLEIFNGRRTWIHPEAKKLIPLIARLHENLKCECKHLDGVLVENKRFSIALHYRLAKKSARVKLFSLLKPHFRDKTLRRNFLIAAGKKVWELKPAVKWNKGLAALHILKAYKKKNGVVLFIGDDLTDEEAFKTLRGKALTFRVAPKGPTNARFRFQSQSHVKHFLAKLLQLRTDFDGCIGAR